MEREALTFQRAAMWIATSREIGGDGLDWMLGQTLSALGWDLPSGSSITLWSYRLRDVSYLDPLLLRAILAHNLGDFNLGKGEVVVPWVGEISRINTVAALHAGTGFGTGLIRLGGGVARLGTLPEDVKRVVRELDNLGKVLPRGYRPDDDIRSHGLGLLRAFANSGPGRTLVRMAEQNEPLISSKGVSIGSEAMLNYLGMLAMAYRLERAVIATSIFTS